MWNGQGKGEEKWKKVQKGKKMLRETLCNRKGREMTAELRRGEREKQKKR